MPIPFSEAEDRARQVRLVLLDVDGVLTDGRVAIHSDGSESKDFFIRDGAAMVWAPRLGIEVGLLSGRPSEATTRRAMELGVTLVSQSSTDKASGLADVLATRDYAEQEVAYMGDDLLDLPVFARVGLSAAPADAASEVIERADWVSRFGGGRGAVREFIELIIRARGEWNTLFSGFVR
jgi:3-deoxy-D-manno-octulosonate 8-phosphate phosphatase (KDO 8-P phosphatase)